MLAIARRGGLFAALLFSLTFGVSSVSRADFKVPSLTGPVVDAGGMLSPHAQRMISQVLHHLYSSGGSQINVLTVPSLEGEPIEMASIKVVDQWKLGNKKLANGVLLLVSRDDHKIRIEVGQGLESSLTDVQAHHIIDEVIVPAFKNRDFDRGILQGLASIISLTDPKFIQNNGPEFDSPQTQRQSSPQPAETTPSEGSSGLGLLLLFFILKHFGFFFVIFLIILLRIMGGPRGPRGGGYYGGFGGGGWGGGGFGGGGGGWSGGGGGFNGGGSSGSW